MSNYDETAYRAWRQDFEEWHKARPVKLIPGKVTFVDHNSVKPLRKAHTLDVSILFAALSTVGGTE